MLKADVLIIGSGVAGLFTAIKIARGNKELDVLILSKDVANECNTKYAQGGIAVVHNLLADSFEKHIQDTLKAGDGLSDPEVVKIVVEEGPERLNELIEMGTKFDYNHSGEYDLGREGGHSEYRVLHHKDITGFEIERALLQTVDNLDNVTLLENHYAIDLITQHHLGGLPSNPKDIECFGAYVLVKETNEILKVSAKITVLASGGAGQVYQATTNPKVATGDGIAMAYRAKAIIKDMEFVQFHPTALYEPGKSPAFLISEAVRGFGAKLRVKSGEFFMQNYDPREELASRDIVAKAIDNELKKRGDDFVCLDCTHLDYDDFVKHFPNINDKCISVGIDIRKDYIPVVPASHYTCGGIMVDHYGRTSVQKLYACGEASRTGLHGANRLASNSLLEAIVYGHRLSLDILDRIVETPFPPASIPEWNADGTTTPRELILISQSIKDLQSVMSNYMGIVRSEERMRRATKRIALLWEETREMFQRSVLSPQLAELRNLVTVAYLITEQSKQRKENKGAFFNNDLV